MQASEQNRSNRNEYVNIPTEQQASRPSNFKCIHYLVFTISGITGYSIGFGIVLLLKSNDLMRILNHMNRLLICYCFLDTLFYPHIDLQWNQSSSIVAGGNGKGLQLDQLNNPSGMDFDIDNQTIYITDTDNDRIVAWQIGAKKGRIVAGGNGQGDRNDQLNHPVDVIIDYYNDALIIADYRNTRIVRWPRQNGQRGEIIISDIMCRGLAMNKMGDLYVLDNGKVRRWKRGEKQGTTVVRDHLNQLFLAHYIFVDDNESIYVSDLENNRVMKWLKGATEGLVVAGDQGFGGSLRQFLGPSGIFADKLGTIYVADRGNGRVIRWFNGSIEGEIVIAEYHYRTKVRRLAYPIDLAFDKDNNLYVLDSWRQCVHKFEFIKKK